MRKAILEVQQLLDGKRLVVRDRQLLYFFKTQLGEKILKKIKHILDELEAEHNIYIEYFNRTNNLIIFGDTS